MPTLPPYIEACKVIADAIRIASCPHPVLEKQPDGFSYCRDCGGYVHTLDDVQD